MSNVAVLGSTGSIGRSTLQVIAASAGRFRAVALSGHCNWSLLAEQSAHFGPQFVVATGPEPDPTFLASLPPGTDVRLGSAALSEIARRPEVDIVVAALVGSCGLESTWAALEAGKRVALANKETLVMGGPLVMRLAQTHGGSLLPVDSEHSAVFQALQSGRRSEVKKVILTASGGPFRGYSSAQLAEVKVEAALRHPTWRMGRKITVDSATLMNKALEIIEARWLFGLDPEQIDVVIHPQSVVHSLVEFVDGSVMAQLSPPDMRLPIQYALTYPERTGGTALRFDWAQRLELEFEPPDRERFPAIDLGLEVAAAGGTAGAVMNAANEAAVASFLAEELPFTEIVPACRSVLEHHDFDPNPTLSDLLRLDRWAREEVARWICT